MHPESPKLKMHKYQHIYAWGLYSLMNIMWVTIKDYKLLFRYEKQGLLRKEKLTLKRALTELSLLKVLYISYMFVLPIMFSGIAWYHLILGFLAMHMVAGLALACIFQPAHVMESSDYASPNVDLKMENNWAVHQLVNTTNFAPKSTVTSWFIGGLNYQIEHHLFPQVCHVHYPALSKIVKEVAGQYNLPYNVQPTVYKALVEHGRMLKILGNEN
jgi:linoleoyl-CoA desaturase